MKKTGWLFLLMMAIAHYSKAQRYLVRFSDKGSSPFSLSRPAEYLSQRAIERRQRYNIPVDSTDLPVTPRYLDSVRSVPGVTILNVSKWLNQIAVQINNANALNKINSFPFVLASSRFASRLRNNTPEEVIESDEYVEPTLPRTMRLQNTAVNYFNYGESQAQIQIHKGEFLHNIGLRGQNMIVGMLDEGYYNYTSLSAFDSINANKQVLGTWDFVNREASVTEDGAHGMQCFSVLAANIPGQFVGSAPKASYYLFKTEDSFSEYPIEELNWVCGAERIDSAGGDVISSSVGYRTFDDGSLNYSYADMNGKTTIASAGADLASKKGLAVINAAGNDGSNWWKYIITPADADSVLAVGAVNGSGQVWPNSAFGPSSDGRVKPDVASVGSGAVVQYPNNTIGGGFGTSFACPNMAGLVTCLWQGFPEYNNIKILNTIRWSSSNFTQPNDRTGYGIPDVKKALVQLVKEFATSNAEMQNCQNRISWTSKDMAAMRYELERKTSEEVAFRKVADFSGSGTVFATHTYQFTDPLNNVPSGPVSYRIREIIDTTAAGFTAEYIDTVFTEVPPPCSKRNVIKIAPNPARTSFSLQVAVSAAITNLTIRIVNMQGSTVALLHKTKPEGEYKYDIPVVNFPSGKYLVSVYNNQELIETKELIRLW